MILEAVMILVATLGLSVALTAAVRKLASSHGLIDIPNKRSSHSVPTPRGGGIAIAAATSAALASLVTIEVIPLQLVVALLGGGTLVAFVGYLDDRFQLPLGIRLAAHVAAAVWALVWLGGLPTLQLGDRVVTLGWGGYVLGVVGIVWSLNLFNFMDGIDALAAAEAVFVAIAAAVLTIGVGGSAGVVAASLALAAAACGFLIWNWPPATIFMGDVGSGFLGYVIAVLAVAAARENSAALFVWMILGAAFMVDASVTVVRRLARRERIYEAHRTHAYQWLSRRWGSHKRVTLALLVINVCWLLPLAWYANVHPVHALDALAFALASLTILALLAGAGRREGPSAHNANAHRE